MPDFPLEDLLRTADSSPLDRPPPDLAGRVRRRAAKQTARTKALRATGITASVAAVLTIVVWSAGWVPDFGARPKESVLVTATPKTPQLDPAEIQRLDREAADLNTRAEELQREVALMRQTKLRSELRANQRPVGLVDPQPRQDAIDRAASVAVCEGDFLWDVRHSREAARAAYETVVNRFPDSQWAGVARDRLNQLQMN